MGDGHDHAATFDGRRACEYKRRLIIVTAINIAHVLRRNDRGTPIRAARRLQARRARSLRRMASAYALSFWAIGQGVDWRCGPGAAFAERA